MRKHIQRIQTSFLLFFTFFALAACGGGGGSAPTNSGGSGSGDGGDAPTTGITGLSVSLLQNGSDPDSAITSISNSNPGVILVQLEGSDEAIAGQIVSFSTTLAQLEKPSDLSDSAGVAQVAISAGDASPQAGTITVTAGSVQETVNFEVVSSGTVSTTGYTLDIGLYESGVNLNNLDAYDEIESVSTFGSAFFVVEVMDVVTGNPVESAIINVETSAGDLKPSSGQILTNVNGVAAAEISAGSSDPGAAATLTATIEEVSASLNFAFGSVDLEIGRDAKGFVDPDDIDFVENQIDIAATGDLSANGTTVLKVVVVSSEDTTTGFDTPLTVNFTSACAQSGDAEIDTGITTVNGIAEATYTAAGCEGDDVITATVAEASGISATGTVTIEDASVGSIVFVGADPAEITLRGIGTDTSTVTFRVLDASGSGFGGQNVTASLSSVIGGITIEGETDGTAAETTSSDGTVSFSVTSGNVPTSVRVKASVIDAEGGTISTLSGALAIVTGQPDNDSFSLSASVLNPGGYDFDGYTSELTIRAADAFNNPVPDGTTVIFTTEYGAVQGSCDTVEGACTRTWNSQLPRAPQSSQTGRVLNINELACDSNADGTADTDSIGTTVDPGNPCPTALVDPSDTDFPGQIYGGRTTILAYAQGEESFVDTNANGLYDAGEPFVDLSEAFLDHNEDGVFGGEGPPGACTGVGTGNSIPTMQDVNDIDNDGDTAEMIGAAELCANWQEGGAEEEFVDFNSNGVYDWGNGIYNGSLCQATDEANDACTTELVYVRQDIKLNVGGSTPYITIYDEDGVTQMNSADADFDVDVSGGGVESRVFRISDLFNGPLPTGTTFTVTSESCKLSPPTTYITPDESRLSGHSFTVTVSDNAAAEAGEFGLVSMEVSVPASAGGITSFPVSFGCTD